MLPARPGHPVARRARGAAPLSAGATLRGGIIAAGDGRRLRAAGFGLPKPLLPVGGVPLIDSAIANFAAAGVGSLVIIVNAQAGACVEHVRSRFPALDVEFIVKTTHSSLESFFEVASHPEPGRMVIATVDAVCRAEDFARFVAAAALHPPDAVVLAVTPFVADEDPLWVNRDDDGLVTALGGSTGAFVSAGFYLVPERIRRMRRPAELPRLRDFLGWLVAQGERVYAEVIEIVVDVDRGEDVVMAEALRAERVDTAKR